MVILLGPWFLIQGSKRNKTIAEKLLYISNDDTQNFPFYGLKLVVKTFGHTTSLNQKSPKSC